jgi:hypothetical protein
MSNFVHALRAELQELEAQLANDPRYRRAQKIRDLLIDYESQPPQHRELKEELIVLSEGSKESKIKRAITALLRENRTLHRTVILQFLIDRHLMGTEKDPLRALAAYLSNWKDTFVSDGAGNFSLAGNPAKIGEFELTGKVGP